MAGLICGILAIIFGSIASRGNKRLGSRDGSGMATAGLITGIIALAGYVCWFVFWFIWGAAMIGAAASAAHGAG
ncbi:MAG: DUF4190 domain-containing protein [Phycisphaerae bacterium]|nr:DUF4190 domain-containing protein [Phycisphaerae bacterium]